jgi:nucleoside-diphosphate-sugar epimerase
MRIVIAGGHGQIARQLGRLVAQAGHQPVGIIRKPEYVPDLQEDGVDAALLDLEATGVEELTDVVRGADAVVFAAGGRPGRGRTPLRDDLGDGHRERGPGLRRRLPGLPARQAGGRRRPPLA